jgi:hypothetical protein
VHLVWWCCGAQVGSEPIPRSWASRFPIEPFEVAHARLTLIHDPTWALDDSSTTRDVKDEPMIVTRDFLEAHRSARGGWTRAQLAAIGVPWPPPAGWMGRIVGTEITEAQRAAFVAAHEKKGTVDGRRP